jgi:uncharacterized protein (TIRG00374 family)
MDEPSGIELRPRAIALRALVLVALLGAVVAAVELLVPGAGKRLAAADPAWLAVGVAFEALALTGYAVFFHAVFARRPYPLSMRRSAEIALGELAGYALLPGGVGGPVLRFWSLRGGGMPWLVIGARSVVHAVLFNIPYLGAALVFGLGVLSGVLPGSASTLTALAPLILIVGSVGLILLVVATRRMRWLRGERRWQRLTREVLAVVPAGLRELPWHLRHPVGLAGSFAWWTFDCAVLWAAFQACGGEPAIAVVVLGYMLGQLGNLLPLPGGIGGVEPLMLGIFVASGVDAGLAAAAIVCYRAIALGVQSGLGAIAFATLAPEIGKPRADSADSADSAG